jgi:hypothetical protein
MADITDYSKFYTIKSTGDGYVAVLNTAALSGVPNLPNIELKDTSEMRLVARASKVVRETIRPSDIVIRKLAQQMIQQKLIS